MEVPKVCLGATSDVKQLELKQCSVVDEDELSL